ncbi:hypothetical protein IAG44_04195 [Streptomyces roseirectus]|uniref:Uncharacterized protein n=1 Tax=Streptomyces roseirectus TaxID=2768066 RepID=A0A7H0I7H1_9ACTN|nr:hypothetical protein [Streptomyces roseirectus]QNP68737.1 hypothetical protein IAG44_04195 [Streptomyces roseirectus]
MTTAIDDLLHQSLLLRDPRVPSDVVPYDEYDDDVSATAAPGDPGALRGLTALSEAALLHCTPGHLADFVTDQLPEPRVAWTLGCALHLAGLESGARFWWQYAAGAGDPAAAYSLHLHHLAHGDPHAAAFWRAQTCDDDGDDGLLTADTDTATVLRVLSRLTEQAPPRAHTPAATAVIDFVGTAVAIGYDRHPGVEIPLPGPDFAQHLEIIAAATSAPRRPATRLRPLPNRPTAETRPAAETTLERLMVEATSEDGPGAFKALKDAVADCWPGRFRVKTDDSGTNPRYYLVR